MPKVLVNDGIHPTGEKMLKDAGFEVVNKHLGLDELKLQLPEYDAITVRSATKVRKELIDLCPNLKVIARGGVGLDNIDVEYAQSKNVAVYNTPAASTRSVAELAITKILSLSRSVYLSNREMPQRGEEEFKKLKKSYSKGTEIEGKTLGIIGFGRIGQELASIAIGLGMEVLPVSRTSKKVAVNVGPKKHNFKIDLDTVSMEDMLQKADYISLHVPSTEQPIIGQNEINKMKQGAIIVNTARGGSIDEDALLEGLNSGKIKSAGLGVYVGEPKPRKELLNHPSISVTPHTGASTLEAQEKIGIELADQIINYFK